MEQCGGIVEQWNSEAVIVEQCGWWNRVVEQWNSVVEQWSSVGGKVKQ